MTYTGYNLNKLQCVNNKYFINTPYTDNVDDS